MFDDIIWRREIIVFWRDAIMDFLSLIRNSSFANILCKIVIYFKLSGNLADISFKCNVALRCLSFLDMLGHELGLNYLSLDRLFLFSFFVTIFLFSTFFIQSIKLINVYTILDSIYDHNNDWISIFETVIIMATS